MSIKQFALFERKVKFMVFIEKIVDIRYWVYGIFYYFKAMHSIRNNSTAYLFI